MLEDGQEQTRGALASHEKGGVVVDFERLLEKGEKPQKASGTPQIVKNTALVGEKRKVAVAPAFWGHSPEDKNGGQGGETGGETGGPAKRGGGACPPGEKIQ